MEEKDGVYFRRRALSEAGIAYSVSAVAPVILALIVGVIGALAAGAEYAKSDWYLFLSYLIPQLCFAAAALVYFRRSGVSPRRTYGGCQWYYFPLAVLLQFGLMFSLAQLNDVFIGFLEDHGYHSSGVQLPSLEGWNLLPALLIIALLPAVFEETLFRGILVKNMHGCEWGTAVTVLVSGAMFALFHGRPEQTLYQFVCGMCFALAALRAGSILPAMAAHFCNNAAVLILTATGYGEEGGWTMAPAADIAVTVLAALCFIASLLFFLLQRRKEERPRAWAMPHKGAFFLSAGVGIAVCAVQWIVTLVTGFLHG